MLWGWGLGGEGKRSFNFLRKRGRWEEVRRGRKVSARKRKQVQGRALGRSMVQFFGFISIALLTNVASSFILPHIKAKTTTKLDGENRISENNESQPRPTRRLVMRTLAVFLAIPAPVIADDDFGADVRSRVFKAVTTSDLGISVRRSVVKGAQMMDSIDGKWERFSDDNGLGSARKRQPPFPKPLEVPPLKPFNSNLARSIINASDDAFIKSFDVSPQDLREKIDKTRSLVAPVFQISSERDEFNFESYVHFRSYNELLKNAKLGASSLNDIRSNFERLLGQSMIDYLPPDTSDDPIDQVRSLSSKFQERGFVALATLSDIDPDDIADFKNDLVDFTFTIALDQDGTQEAQILLQEQGFRALIPNFVRIASSCILKNAFQKQLGFTVNIDEYYMDTNYNSDPDKFKVRQVLLNIVISR